MRNCLLRAVSLLSISVSLSGVASAQSAAGEEDQAMGGEIIVTATRRGESIQNVPLSIVALSKATLDQQGLKNIDDVARLTPGLNFTTVGDRGQNNIAIRGVQSTGGASTTGIYIDDIPVQARRVGFAGGSPFPRIFDLERVEVLRGPQGTLFGAGSQGGTIRFITPQPSLSQTSVYARSELATTRSGGSSYEAGVGFGVPLIQDRLGVRISGWHRHEGGWIDRVDYRNLAVIDRNANREGSTVIKGALVFALTDNIKLTPSVFYQREKKNDVGSIWENISDPDAGEFNNGNAINAPSFDKFIIPSLTVNIDLPFASFVSVSSYMDRKQGFDADYTEQVRAQFFGNPFPPIGAATFANFRNYQKAFAQEVRLQSPADQRFRWLIGGFYQHSKQNAAQIVTDSTIVAELAARGQTFTQRFGREPINGTILYSQDPFKTVDEQIAGFGQVDFDVTPRLTLTAGVRIARAKFDFITSVAGPLGGQPFTDIGKQRETPVTPKFGAQYKFDDYNNVYASAAKGYRVGGVNQRPLTLCSAALANLGLLGQTPVEYGSDSVWSYEIGSKNSLFNRALTVNSSAYYIKWRNIQQFISLPGCASGFTDNLGTATSKGFDIQISLNVGDNINLGASVGYQHAEFNQTVFVTTPVPGRSSVSQGDRLPGAPWKVVLNGVYNFPDILGYDGYLRLDYQYSSADPTRQYQNNRVNGFSFNPTFYTRPATQFVSARAGMKFQSLDLSLFVDNVFDNGQSLTRESQNNTALYRLTTFRPRTVGLTAVYRY